MLPGLAGTDHVGFTVPNLDAAERFFVDVIGCERVYSLGPFSAEDDWMLEHLNLAPRTVMRELRFFRCRTGPSFEIFEYEPPEPPAGQPCNSDIGGHHLAFYVDDIDEAVSYLIARDVRVMGAPTASSGPSEGQRWVYFLTPWGMQLELVSYPMGKAYEEGATTRLWHPAHPAE
jgi:glyoxylase I family protein